MYTLLLWMLYEYMCQLTWWYQQKDDLPQLRLAYVRGIGLLYNRCLFPIPIYVKQVVVGSGPSFINGGKQDKTEIEIRGTTMQPEWSRIQSYLWTTFNQWYRTFMSMRYPILAIFQSERIWICFSLQIFSLLWWSCWLTYFTSLWGFFFVLR